MLEDVAFCASRKVTTRVRQSIGLSRDEDFLRGLTARDSTRFRIRPITGPEIAHPSAHHRTTDFENARASVSP